METLALTVCSVAVLTGFLCYHADRGFNTIWDMIFILCAVALGSFYSYGQARPFEFDYYAPAELEVLWFRLNEPNEIVFTIPGENGTTLLYSIPWDQEQAKQLMGAMENNQEDGGTLKFKPSDGLDEQEPVFHNYPPESLPEKK